jgi:uncharacterized spore protein YtfJ
METLDPTPPADAAIARPLERIVGELRHAIETEGNVRTLFGEPMKLDEHTVIPVMTLEIGFGGGGGIGVGKLLRGAIDLAKRVLPGSWGAGGGGGLSIRLRPAGFIRDDKDGPRFVPIALAAVGKNV